MKSFKFFLHGFLHVGCRMPCPADFGDYGSLYILLEVESCYAQTSASLTHSRGNLGSQARACIL